MSMFVTKPDPKKEFEPNAVENNEGGILSKLFRVILKDTNKVNQIGLLVQRYFDRETRNNKNAPNIVKVRNKSTVLSNAKLGSMSIKVFFSLLRDLFCIKWVRITIELEWPDGKISTHQVDSKLGNLNHNEENIDENETETSNSGNN